ncbi:MAG: ROK family protein [Anaerolineae bacterium]|nr:ROK family protein [Anaerolineae bacterium]
MTEYVVGIDLGGTRMRAALLDHELNMVDRQEVPTDARRGRDATLDRMHELVQQILPDDPQAHVGGIGISAPGPVNPNLGLLVAPPNLPGWHNVPLVEILQKAFGYSTYLGNDANVAALAETARGAARGYRHVIFVTLSTGIGGGIISDGRLLLGKDGLAAEVGHMPLVVGETVTTLEKEAAGPALARKARARIEGGEKSIISEMVNGRLEDCTGKVVGRAAVQGDALALSIVQRAGFIVGLGMTSLLHVFNPEILVFGGGVSNLGEMLFAPMREAIQKYCIDSAYWQDLQIKPAELGENVSLVGAAALVITRGGMEDVAGLTHKLDGA